MLCSLFLAQTVLKSCSPPGAPGAPFVDLGYAKYQGYLDTTLNIVSYLGIRYAAAPIGDLRFREPQPPANVSDLQLAITQPPACPQASGGQSPYPPFPQTTADEPEDCLFLNVFTPTNATGPLPVVVWIHGGGYIAGDTAPFSGSVLIQEANYGIVSVMIQYRLGVFGFLPGEKVKENGALNAGILDQDFALRWVNKNIHLFRGDPAKVTIWGQSAGAGSVLQHVVARNGKTQPQLFRAAITSSTFLPSQYEYNARIPELLYNEVVSQTNCAKAADTLACLRDVDVQILQAVNANISSSGFTGTFLFVPVVDGTFITQRPTLSMAQRKVNGEALYAVATTFEGRIFVPPNLRLNASEYARQLFPEFGPLQGGEVAKQYAGVGSDLDQEVAIYGESIFTCPTYFLLDAFPGHSFKAEFAVLPANHGDDLAYVFGWTPSFNNPDFIKAYSWSFLSFAMFSDPNVNYQDVITPEIWPTFSEGNTEMLFNRTDAGKPVVKTVATDNVLLERCRFWESVGKLTGQ